MNLHGRECCKPVTAPFFFIGRLSRQLIRTDNLGRVTSPIPLGDPIRFILCFRLAISNNETHFSSRSFSGSATERNRFWKGVRDNPPFACLQICIGASRNFEKRGGIQIIQCINPVVIYRKSRSVLKKATCWTNFNANRGGGSLFLPLLNTPLQAHTPLTRNANRVNIVRGEKMGPKRAGADPAVFFRSDPVVVVHWSLGPMG